MEKMLFYIGVLHGCVYVYVCVFV